MTADDVAALAVLFLGEVESPAPDLSLRAEYRNRLSRAIRSLEHEEYARLVHRANEIVADHRA